MEEIKRVKDFIYQYRDDGTVAIAKIAAVSNLMSQIRVHEKMSDSVAEPNGKFCDLVYENILYVAIVFKNISEEELIKVLSQ